jgi:hypothetical protein
LSEEPAPKAAPLAPVKRAQAPVVLASIEPAKPVAVQRIVPMPAARPNQMAVAAVMPKPRPAEKMVATAALANNVFDNRGYWRGAVETGEALPPPAQQTPFEVASAGPLADVGTTGSAAKAALAYATESETTAPARARPMGAAMPKLAREAAVMPVTPNTTVLVKPPQPQLLASGGQRPDSPWMRAAMLTPSVSGFLSSTQLGAVDPRPLQELMLKPGQSLVMTFSADPHLGLTTDRFTGGAVEFLATATFTSQAQASVQ